MEDDSLDTKCPTKAWLIKDDALIAKSLDKSITEIAALLQRDPLDVLRHFSDDRAQDYLAKAGHSFDFIPGSEEEAELFGLAMAGVPLNAALLWCSADERRPDANTLQSMMPDGDCRPALHMARELGIWISRAGEIDDLRFLEEAMPTEITQAAIEDLLDGFQPPTPGIIRQYVEGELPKDRATYAWYVEGRAAPQRTYASRSKGYSSRKPRRTSGRRFSSNRGRTRSRRAYA